jgi:Mrp family chromosome partitioning ATPase
MITHQHSLAHPDSLLAAAWRFRWLVAAFAILGALLALGYGVLVPDRYRAVADMVVEDPRRGEVFGQTGSGGERQYMASHVALLESASLAEAAIAVGGLDVDLNPFLETREISADADADLVTIAYEATAEPEAVRAVNAIGEAYQALLRDRRTADAEAAIDELNTSLEAIDGELAAVRQQVADALAAAPGAEELGGRYQEAVDELLTLERDTADEEDRERIEALQVELTTLTLVGGFPRDDPQILGLLEREKAIISRRLALETRVDEIQIDARLSPIGVVLFSAASTAERLDTTVRDVAAGLVLGGLAGVAAAYALAQRNRRIEHRYQPESTLQAPLLAEVPDFRHERIRDLVPVRLDPASVSAESFRFVATALETLVERSASDGHGVVAVVTSAATGEGKSVVTANSALAATRTGMRVLVVDADFGEQTVSTLLVREPYEGVGMTDVVLNGVGIAEAVVSTGDPTRQLDVLARGTKAVMAPDFFRLPDTRRVVDDLASRYDLVLIDGPALLQIAYTRMLLDLSDTALVVVPHRSRVGLVEETHRRLVLTGTPVLGYVYNRAPLDPNATGTSREALGIESARGSRRIAKRRRRQAMKS